VVRLAASVVVVLADAGVVVAIGGWIGTQPAMSRRLTKQRRGNDFIIKILYIDIV